jgi:hypothetical protein
MEASKLAMAAASRHVSLSSGGHESSCRTPSLLFSRGYPMVIEPELDLCMPYLGNPKCKGVAGHRATAENDSSSLSWTHSLPGHSRYQGSWYTDKPAPDLTF